MSFKPGFESRERESQFNTAGGSEFQVIGVAVPNVNSGRIPRRILKCLYCLLQTAGYHRE